MLRARERHFEKRYFHVRKAVHCFTDAIPTSLVEVQEEQHNLTG
jgi:hypothetical protein